MSSFDEKENRLVLPGQFQWKEAYLRTTQKFSFSRGNNLNESYFIPLYRSNRWKIQLIYQLILISSEYSLVSEDIGK